MVERRHQNRITGLEDKFGVWKDNRRDVEDIIIQHFMSIFTSNKPNKAESILQEVDQMVT
ncbi:hypothetical protein L1049_019462 [Liquidambar formosana]|uniref:Uncharacterized protein n=1 Tax=Liquidambar formosana TaxID=63359 RepID=A0AAP0SCM4_LIQFO